MSDCCLPNLGCLSIPIESTNVLGPPGPGGLPGRGITTAFYNPANGTLLLNYNDGTSENVGVVQGAPGPNGGPGVDGVSRLYSNFVSSSAAAPLFPTFYSAATYPVPANMLLNNGDSLVINLRTQRGSTTGNCQRRITWNGTSITTPFLAEVEMLSASAIYHYNTRVEIVRTSATTAICNVVSDYDLKTNNASSVQTYTYRKTISSANFGVINTISADLAQGIANQAVFQSMTIDKITAI